MSVIPTHKVRIGSTNIKKINKKTTTINCDIKIKNGYDYSQSIIDEKIFVNDFDILSSGKITKYEGSIFFSKKDFYQISLDLFERMIMKPPGFFSNNFLTSKKYKIIQKIKLNKVNYIDRENFGIIVSVSKVKEN